MIRILLEYLYVFDWRVNGFESCLDWNGTGLQSSCPCRWQRTRVSLGMSWPENTLMTFSTGLSEGPLALNLGACTAPHILWHTSTLTQGFQGDNLLKGFWNQHHISRCCGRGDIITSYQPMPPSGQRNVNMPEISIRSEINNHYNSATPVNLLCCLVTMQVLMLTLIIHRLCSHHPPPKHTGWSRGGTPRLPSPLTLTLALPSGSQAGPRSPG